MELLTVLASVVLIATLVSAQTCSFDSNRVVRFPGDVNIAVFLSIHGKAAEGCGDLDPSVVQELEAFRLVFDQLNAENYIPGVTLGMVVYDTCSDSGIAAENLRILISTVDEKYNATCQTNTTEFIFGIAGPSTSEEAIALSRILKAENPDDRLVQISHSATATTLTTNSEFENAFSIVPPDSLQSQVIIETMKKLGWNYVALAYSDDSYGRQGAAEIIKLSNSSGICLAFIEKISFDDVSESLHRIFATTVTNTRARAQGIVFFGDPDIADKLLEGSRGSTDVEFIFSDSMQLRYDIFSKHNDIAPGAVIISPKYERLGMLQNYLTELSENRTFLSERALGNKWLEKLYREKSKCHGSTPLSNCPGLSDADKKELTTQSPYAYYAVQVAYLYAKLIKNTHQELCIGGGPGLCTDLRQISRAKIITKLLTFSVSYATDFSNAPKELHDGAILFNLNGSRSSSGGLLDLYDVANYNRNCTGLVSTFCFNKVGSYKGNELILNVDSIKSYSSSGVEITRIAAVCEEDKICESCLRTDSSRHWIYVPGDVIIVGLAPIYNPGSYPFTCADIRLEKGFQLAEAILFAVEQINKKKGIFASVFPGKKIGVLIMNTCYSETISQKGTYSVFFGDDPYLPTGSVDIGSKIIGFVGSVKSDVSEDVANVLTKMKVVQIAYGSTSVSLGNRNEYPYFMRTCASDEQQGEIMVRLLKQMGWTYFSVVYVDDSYGQNGLAVIKRISAQESMCIAQDIPVENIGNPNYFSALEKLRKTPSARVVILFLRSAQVTKMLEDFSLSGSHDYRTGEFIFILTESVGNRVTVIENAPAAEGSVSLLQAVPSNAEFDDYLSKKNVDTPDLPEWLWLEEYWEKYLVCYRNKSFDKSNPAQPCSPNANLTPDTKYFQDPWTPFAINAVFSLSLGASAATERLCPDQTLCEDFKSRPETVREEILKARLDLFGTGSRISAFDDNGDGRVGFTLFNIQMEGSRRVYKEVGRWNKEEGVILQTDLMKFGGDGAIPVSVCPNERECSMCRQNDTTCQGASAELEDSLFLGVIGGLICVVVIFLAILALICFRARKSDIRGKSPSVLNRDLNSESGNPMGPNFREEPQYLNPLHRDLDDYFTIPAPQPGVQLQTFDNPGKETTSDSGKGASGSDGSHHSSVDPPPAMCPMAFI